MRTRSEDGFAAVEMVAGIGLLVLPVVLVVLTLPRWAERQSVARVIAREVARDAAARGACDVPSAVGLGASMARNLGVAPGEVSVRLGCEPGSLLAAGTSVQADVAMTFPGVFLPGLGPVGSWTWTARHREPVDSYKAQP